MLDNIRTDLVLCQTTASHVLKAPIEKIDVSKWLLHLPEAEYQRCAPGEHIAAGFTTTDDGRPMSINVEMSGTNLVIQHYVGEITEKLHFKMVSVSDLFISNVHVSNVHVRMQVIWEINVKAVNDGYCEFTNMIVAHPTEEFLDTIKKQDITFEQVASGSQMDVEKHNARETPLFAESIARAARVNS